MFIVTGTGHNGTKFVADLLCALGHPCGHEAVFDHNRVTSGAAARVVGLHGDSSLAASTYFERVPPHTRVLIVERPLEATLRSYLRTPFFADVCGCHEPGAHRGAPYARWMESEMPGLFGGDPPDEARRAAQWITQWPHIIRRRANAWRLLYLQVTLDSLNDPGGISYALTWLTRVLIDRHDAEAAWEAVTVGGMPNSRATLHPPRDGIDEVIATIMGEQ